MNQNIPISGKPGESVVSDRKLERAQARVRILERMVEDKTRELYEEQRGLEKANRFLTRVLETMRSVVMVCGSDMIISVANKATTKVLGVTPAELIGKDIRSALPPNWFDLPEGSQDWRVLHGRELDERHRRALDGQDVPVSVSLSVLLDDDFNFDGLVCVITDVTARKELESRLLQSQKLESIGGLAAGVAHEINTPIQYVRDNSIFLGNSQRDFSAIFDRYQHLVDKLKASPHAGEFSAELEQVAALTTEKDLPYLLTEVPVAIEQTLQGAEAVARIVRSLKEFSHPGSQSKTAIDLNRAVESVATVSRNEWKYVAELKLELAQNLPAVPCFPGELNQVILNLIVNAAHAIGEVTSEGRNGQGVITVRTAEKNGMAEISITDTGTGIPEHIRQKIFDPFFTTKGVGKGTGQGLTLAHSIVVKKHGGELSFDTETGKGTTFYVRLPLAG